MTDFTLATAFATDPRRLCFAAARYKHAAKMLAGMGDVAEVGAGDGILSAIVAQTVDRLVRFDLREAPGVLSHDMLSGPLPKLPLSYDAVYSLDVLEHVQPEQSDLFVGNIAKSLRKYGTCVIGMPSLESQIYASPGSKAEHVNCLTEEGLRTLMKRHFHSVFMFSMADEALGTGYGPMAQYRIALCSTPK